MGKYEPLGDFLRSQHTQEVPVTFDEIERITGVRLDRKSTRLNSSHSQISYAVFCLKKKTTNSCAPLIQAIRTDPPRTTHEAAPSALPSCSCQLLCKPSHLSANSRSLPPIAASSTHT